MEIPKDFLEAAGQDAVAIAVAAERLEKDVFFYGGPVLLARALDMVNYYEQFTNTLQAIQTVYKEMLG
jgi:hypothetical protein